MFDGNNDQNTVVRHNLTEVIMARYIRFQPTEWHVHISMRVELYGCYAGNAFFLYMLSALITSRNVSGIHGGKIKNRHEH